MASQKRTEKKILWSLIIGQLVDLAETDENENENERGNENEKGNGRQESYRCGIGRRSCKPTSSCKIVCSGKCDETTAKLVSLLWSK